MSGANRLRWAAVFLTLLSPVLLGAGGEQAAAPEIVSRQWLNSEPDNLRDHIRKHDIQYPVAVDNDSRIWQAYHNRAWPSIYLIGKQGHIRYKRIGEGGYQETEGIIQALLAE